jgi:primosomal protein N' (replication factor Y)
MSPSKAKTSPLPKFVEAALPVPLRRAFTYRIPDELKGAIKVGARLKLPFGRRNLIGYAVGLHNELPPGVELDESKIKDIIDVMDAEPLITAEILQLTKWTADYYASFWGEMLKAALPAGLNSEKVRSKRRKAVRLVLSTSFSWQHAVEGATQNKPLTDQQECILDLLSANGGTMLFTELLEQADVGASPINTLAKRGLVEVFVQDVRRDPLDGAEFPDRKDLVLTAKQQAALDQVTSALSKDGEFKAFLLHGVTGSGKTEVYIRAMQFALETGRSALMLVPEIALTPIFSRRLRTIFGSDVAILHSSLSQGERFDEWTRIRRGDARIAIGTRSAVFAPLENLGLVIVDEEHDSSYRQHESPFYNARDVAVMRSHFAGAVVVLGSATPAMESFYNAQTGKYSYLQLPDRIGDLGLAQAEIVDMREVFKRAGGKDVALSHELLDAIQTTHAKGEQTIILLNRRGFSQFVLCRTCGETMKCRNCDITLTFHRRDNKLICHYCNYRETVPKLCTQCESEYLYFVGEGTENIADQLEKKFPSMRIARVDRDTMSHKGEIDDVLLKFAAGDIDMLVGTQMIAKGHDFPNVTLVGVISVDIALGLPDLRSAERTFQLITQVAGRSGRGTRSGKVLIQTYYPEHYALRHACEQDYDGFYKEEIKFRERLAYPPFFVLASMMIKHRDLAYASRNANILRRALDAANSAKNVRILGPAPASISRLKNEYRMQLIIKGISRRGLRETLDIALADAERHDCDMRFVNVEIDPVNLM